MLAISEKTVNHLSKKGGIPVIKVKEKWCFDLHVLDRWIQKKILQNFRKKKNKNLEFKKLCRIILELKLKN